LKSISGIIACFGNGDTRKEGEFGKVGQIVGPTGERTGICRRKWLSFWQIFGPAAGLRQNLEMGGDPNEC
jgi:hypothetical protein